MLSFSILSFKCFYTLSFISPLYLTVVWNGILSDHSLSSIFVISSSLPKNLGHCPLNIFTGLRARWCRLYMLSLCCCFLYPVCYVDFWQHFYVSPAFLWAFQAIIWTQLYGLIVRTYLCPPCASQMGNFACVLRHCHRHGDVWCRASSELGDIIKWMLIGFYYYYFLLCYLSVYLLSCGKIHPKSACLNKTHKSI